MAVALVVAGLILHVASICIGHTDVTWSGRLCMCIVYPDPSPPKNPNGDL